MQRFLTSRILTAIVSASAGMFMTVGAATADGKDQVTYEKDLEQSLRKQWSSHGHDPLRHDNPAVDFTINKDGSISKVTLEKSSGDSALDADALKIVKDMSPLAAPPNGQIDFATIFADIDFRPYMHRMQTQIKQHWIPPKEGQSTKLAVIFKIAKDGSMSHLKIGTSSGVSEVDKAGIKAVTEAAPFEPLPPGANPVDIGFNFDYNVFDKTPAGEPKPTAGANKPTEAKGAVALNNAGVTLLKESQFESAVDVFLQALKLDPGYSLARSNLAIAYNNIAKKQAGTPEAAISALCRSLYLAPDVATTHQNLRDMLIQGRNFSGRFDDYVRLGDEAAANHKAVNAYVMYHEALRQQADPDVVKKAKKLESDADKELNNAPVTQ